MVRRSLSGVVFAALLVLAGCSGDEFTDAERATIASLSLDQLPPIEKEEDADHEQAGHCDHDSSRRIGAFD